MRKYYVTMSNPTEIFYRFDCMADDTDHAEEQAKDAYPRDEVVWVDTDESLKESEYQWLWIA